MKTLKEICAELGVSRRAIQGYEDAGLVKATNKNKYGHLLYNLWAQERIARIKFFQDLGFSIKEIGVLIDASGEVLKPKLIEQVRKLEDKVAKDTHTIQQAKEFINRLE